ncbi:MAG UNVERIFIED_CONTAM: hypothetical protein LVR29_30690 [Microcystis novacekii LVE1205-3]
MAMVLAYVTKQGYRLYEQVWHDHLSGLSLLLNSWLSVTGFTSPCLPALWCFLCPQLC